jgi:DNA-binding GntR family transcriptional regulator
VFTELGALVETEQADAPSALSAVVPLGTSARQTYQLTIRDTLHELIQTLQIPPGERLVEADLAARFAVSKTPVREALMRLAVDGLVTNVPHVGVTVTWLSVHDYEQALFILDALELPALHLVVQHIDDEQLNRCGELIAGMKRAQEHDDKTTYMTLARQFHEQLFATAGFPMLVEYISATQRKMRRHTVAFCHGDPQSWAMELATATARYEHVRARDAAAAAAAVQRGHAEMLASVRTRVQTGDPAVTRYLDPAERP